MSINEIRGQGSTTIIIAGDDAGIINDVSGQEGPFTEYNRYGESTGHNYVRCSVCEAEAPDGETSVASHQPICRYE